MIHDEAVEAAAAKLPAIWSSSPVYRDNLRAALEAAAPYIAGAALREAADQLEYGNPINSWLYERADEIENDAV